MNRASVMPAALVALNAGVPGHAECLVCDDIRGPFSLFGEAGAIPRPFESWNVRPGECKTPEARQQAYDLGRVLWKAGAAASAVAMAETIDNGTESSIFSVPAPTCLVGRCDSTFSVAWALVEDGLLPEWGAVLASCQNEGRGQMRREWHSPRGNLYVTFRLPFDPLLKGDAASLVTGYLMLLAFKSLGFPLALKWPNDLILGRDKKVGGILLEEREGILLAGMGVNLAEAPDTAARLGAATKPGVLLAGHCSGDNADAFGGQEEHIAPFTLWRRLQVQAILLHEKALKGRDTAAVFAALNGVLAWKDHDVLLSEREGTPVRGRCLGVGPEGGILLSLPHGENQEFFSGSLSLA